MGFVNINNQMQGLGLTEDQRMKKNIDLLKSIEQSFKDNKKLFQDLRKKVVTTYWITVTLYVFLFILGIILLSVPVAAAYRGDITSINSLIGGGFGIVDLAVLFLFRPVERIHNLMGDLSQLTTITNSYQQQVGLRLLELNSENRKTLDKAAVEINKAAINTIKLIEEYCETKTESE